MIYLEYLVLVILVVLISVKLSYYVDCLDKKSVLPGAFLGGVMLAAVTSLPELFTSLTAVLFLEQPHLVLGNVLGSNIFNLCIVGGICLFMSKAYQKSQIADSHLTTLLYGLLMYGSVFVAIAFVPDMHIGIAHFSPLSLLILVLYAINVKYMKSDNSVENTENVEVTLSHKQLIARFVMCSIVLVIVSIFLTQVTDKIAVDLNLGATVAGALFLGIATSLPELSSSINLARIGNYNASFGNVVGSNLFNFTILSLADLLYTGSSIYVGDAQVMTILIFGVFSTLATLGLIRGKKYQNVVMLSSATILCSYIVSILLSL